MDEATRLANIEKLRQAAQSAAPVTPAAPAAPSEPAASTPAIPSPGADALDTTGQADTAGTPAVPETPWHRIKIKADEEEHELDLKELAEKDAEKLHTLLGRGLTHERKIAAIRAQREQMREEHEKALSEIEKKRDARWAAAVKRHKLQIEDDETDPDGIRFVPQRAAPDASAPDLDALERAAIEQGTPEALAAYTRAVRAAAERPTLTPEQVKALAKQEWDAARRVTDAQQSKQQKVEAFRKKVDAVKVELAPDFAAAGPDAEYEIGVADKLARDHSREVAEAVGRGEMTVEQAETSVLKVYRDHASRVKQRAKAPAVPAAPRAKAPTVIPSGGSPAAAPPADISKADPRTPEGREARIALIRQQAERNTASPFARV